MDAADRISRLKVARSAAEAVRDEMNRRNDSDPRPSNVLKRAPILRRADARFTDLELIINDLEGTPAPIVLTPDQVANLDRLAAKLDAAIERDALIGVALDSVTGILNAVTDVKDALA